MSQADGDLIREAFAALGTEPLEQTAATYWDADIEYVEDPRWPGASSYRGRDAVVQCFTTYLETLGDVEDITMTVERVVEGAERHVALIDVRSRASASGVPHEHLWGYVVEVRDGRIVYLRAYYEPDEALAAIRG